MSKPRVVKDYDALSVDVQEQIKLFYPSGFTKQLITFKNLKNQFVSALPFETDEKYYLIRMTKAEAQEIVDEDDDYDDDGNLKEDVMDEYEDKHSDDDNGEIKVTQNLEGVDLVDEASVES